jgi:coenzyme F420-reducing hydrogenase beta subunit
MLIKKEIDNMMGVEEAEVKAKEFGMEIKGKIKFDPYSGWIDDAPGKYGENGEHNHCLLCELNVADGFCELCEDDEEPCKIFEN